MGRVVAVPETVSEWCEIMKDITPLEGHKVVCYALNSEKIIHQYEVLEKSEYEENKNNKNIMTLRMIIDESKFFLSKLNENTLKEDSIYKKLTIKNIFSTEDEREITDQIRQCAKICLTLPSILEKMCQRSKNRRLEERVASVWGAIKWLIWLIFYDKTKEIEELKKVNSENPVIKTFSKLIEGRAHENIEALNRIFKEINERIV